MRRRTPLCYSPHGEIKARDAAASRDSRRDEPPAIDTRWRFELSADSETPTDIVAMVDSGRQCCRCLRSQLTLEPDERSFDLKVTGPPRTQELLTALIATTMITLGPHVTEVPISASTAGKCAY